MRTIQEFTLDPSGSKVQVEMPMRAEIVQVRGQGSCRGDGDIVLSAIIETEQAKTQRTFYLVEAGEPFTAPAGQYLGTAVFSGDDCVVAIHVFGSKF